MASKVWRIAGIETTGGGDLSLTELLLWGETGALDANAALYCSVEPTSGTLSALNDGEPGTSCGWSADVVCAPGFFIQWETPADVDAWCVRVAATQIGASIANYDLLQLLPGGWVSARHGRLPSYPAGELTAAVSSAPLFGKSLGMQSIFLSSWSSYGSFDTGISPDGRTAVVAPNDTSANLNISKDGGLTWGVCSRPVGDACLYVGNGGALAFAGIRSVERGLSISKNYGGTWSPVIVPSVGQYGLAGVSASSDLQTLAVSVYRVAQGLRISRDGGSTWLTPSIGVAGEGLQVPAVTPDGQTIVVVSGDSSSGAVFVSHDGGTTWATHQLTKGTYGFAKCAVSADGQVIAVAQRGGKLVFVSRDGGANWVERQINAISSVGCEGIGMSASGKIIAITEYGSSSGFHLSDDYGQTWSKPVVHTWTGGFCRPAVSPGGSLILISPNGVANPQTAWWRKDAIYVDDPIKTSSQQALRLFDSGSTLPQGLQATTSTAPAKVRDMEFGGDGRIYGTVARANKPANSPLSRRVRLHRSRDGLLVRETWSKADGAYEFREISMRYEWDVIAFDHELQEFSTVANNQLAEPMP